jgi:hypothetical protein
MSAYNSMRALLVFLFFRLVSVLIPRIRQNSREGSEWSLKIFNSKKHISAKRDTIEQHESLYNKFWTLFYQTRSSSLAAANTIC